MNAILIGSELDASLTQCVQQTFEESGYTVATIHPDTAGDSDLSRQTINIAQSADYFLYLVTRNSENAGYVRGLLPERVAPLCAAGVKIILVVAGGGSLRPSLAYLPCLFFLDDEMLPAEIKGLVNALHLIDSIQPSDLYDLRYGSRDLETFLDTAQGLSMAYTGLESAWDGMHDHDENSAKSLFERYTSSVNFGVSFLSLTRLENRTSRQAGYSGPIAPILAGYRAMERNWQEIKTGFHHGENVREKIFSARCQTAVLINLIYLVMALKLQPYCDQYLHMNGLKLKQDLPSTSVQPVEGAQVRLAFLFSNTTKSDDTKYQNFREVK